MKIGIAERVITPDSPVFLAGWMDEKRLLKPSGESYKDLIAQAVVIEEGEKRVCIISADLLFFDGVWTDKIREGVRDVVKPHSLLLNASHTHSGPVLDDQFSANYPDKRNPGLCDKLVETLVELVHEAIEEISECHLFYSAGPCTAGINRRRADEKGEIQILPNVQGPYDDDVRALKVTNFSGEVKAIIFNYGLHPNMIYEQLIGPDWVGYARDTVQSEFPGSKVIYIQSFEGDQRARFVSGKKAFLEADIQALKYIGWQVGEAVLSAFTGPELGIHGIPKSGWAEAELPLAEPPTKDEIKKGLAEGRYPKAWAEKWLNAKEFPRIAKMSVQTLEIGDLLTIALGGEVCIGYSTRIRESYPDRRFIFAGCSNSWIGYIPTDEMLKEGGGLEVRMHYGSGRPARFIPGIEKAVMDGIQKALKEAL